MVDDPKGGPSKDEVKKEDVLEEEEEQEEEEEVEDEGEGFDATRGLFNSGPVKPDGTIDDGITSGGDGLTGDLPQPE